MNRIREIDINIERLEKAQKRDTDILNNLKNLNLSAEIVNQKRESLEADILRRKLEIENMKGQQYEISTGVDTELESKQRTEKDALQKKKDNNIKKRKILIDEETERKVKFSSKKREDTEYFKQKEYKRYYRYYSECVNSIHDNKKRKLANMPNNKGYIWRGCVFLGLLAPERNEPTILFEQKGSLLRIHEHTPYRYRLFEKEGDKPKKLITDKIKKKKTCKTIKMNY
jgi:hypothetical protein